MGEVIFFGDIHLSDERPWSSQTCSEIVSFIQGLKENNEDNVAIFTGDMTEHVKLDGSTYTHLLDIFRSLRFKETFVILGNHDIKRKKRGVGYSSPLKILQSKKMFPNITLINTYQILNIEGLKILVLPHLTPEDGGVETYASLPKDIASDSFDIVTGHFADTSAYVTRGETVDISYLKTKHVCLGHIHNAVSPSYIGSLVPNAISEAGKSRFLRAYSKTGEEVRLRKIPVTCILDFYAVKYPEPLPVIKAKVPVWTIDNCRDESVARTLYGNIFIKACLYDVNINFSQFQKYTGVNAQTKSKKSLIQEWLQLNKDNVSEKIKKLVLDYAD